MSGPVTSKTVFRVADLSQTQTTHFSLVPESANLTPIAGDLGLSALRKLRFEGTISAQGASDWRIDAHLGATIVQPCVATLEPVTTRIEEPVTRIYLADFDVPQGVEVEMLEDDTIEPLPKEIDLNGVMLEALALNIPAYPRSDQADPVSTQVTEPGKTPMTDEEARPFAGLAALRDKLTDKE